MLGLAGLLQNVLIGNHYNAHGLGIFSQSLAIYMICSMISTWGIQTSVVKFIAEYQEDKTISDEIISTALWIVLFYSVSITFVLFLLLPFLPNQLINQEIFPVVRNILIGLPLFSLNKVLMGVLNGFRKMQAFAVTQSLRAILLISFTVYFLATNQPLKVSILAFLFTEIALLIWLLASSIHFITFTMIPKKIWVKKHVVFGGNPF